MYGGTKTEMERLVADANEYAAANGQAADLTVDSFADIVTAIDLIQQKQGIAGTTAREAATTIEGSLNMVKGAWTNLISGLANPDADLGQLMDDLVTGLVGENEGEGLINQVVPAFQRIMEAIPTLLEGVGPVVSANLPVVLDSVLPVAIDTFGMLISGLIAAAPDLLATLVSAVSEVIGGLLEELGLSDDFTTIFDGIKTAADEVLPGLSESFSALSEALTPIKDAITSVYDSFTEYATNGTLAADATTLISDGITLLGDGLTLLIDGFTNVVTGITDFVTWLTSGSTSADAFLAIVTGITVSLGLLGAALGISALISTVTAALQGFNVAGAAAKLVIEAATVADNALAVAQGALNAVMALNPFVLVAIAVAGLVAAIVVLWNKNEGFRNAVTTAWDAIKTGVGGVVDALVTFFTTTLPNAFTTLVSKVQQTKDNIVKFFSELPDKMVSIGTNIVEGIWSGISGGYEWIKGKIEGWVGDVLEFFKTILGIHSPSRVMRDLIGVNIVKGIAVGIDKGTPDVQDAINDIESLLTEPITANSSLTVSANRTNGILDGTDTSSATGVIDYVALADAIVAAFIRAGIGIELDDREFGRLVRKAVAY